MFPWELHGVCVRPLVLCSNLSKNWLFVLSVSFFSSVVSLLHFHPPPSSSSSSSSPILLALIVHWYQTLISLLKMPWTLVCLLLFDLTIFSCTCARISLIWIVLIVRRYHETSTTCVCKCFSTPTNIIFQYINSANKNLIKQIMLVIKQFIIF